MVTAPAKRELVRRMLTRGLSERRCLGLVGMSASALRYEPRAGTATRRCVSGWWRWRNVIVGTGSG